MIRTLAKAFGTHPSFTSFYSTLGVSSTASQADIKSAYFALAKKLHPDQPTGNEARFKEINEAYEVLGNEESRARYDSGVQEPPQQTQQNSRYQQGSADFKESQWSRNYYYRYDPFTGRRTYYREDIQPPKGRRYSRRPPREQDFFKDWEEFTRKFNQTFTERPVDQPVFSPFVRVAMVLFGLLWIGSILETAGRSRWEREMFYERPYRP
jgi:curved DNA-binding protein CbpA